MKDREILPIPATSFIRSSLGRSERGLMRKKKKLGASVSRITGPPCNLWLELFIPDLRWKLPEQTNKQNEISSRAKCNMRLNKSFSFEEGAQIERLTQPSPCAEKPSNITIYLLSVLFSYKTRTFSGFQLCTITAVELTRLFFKKISP